MRTFYIMKFRLTWRETCHVITLRDEHGTALRTNRIRKIHSAEYVWFTSGSTVWGFGGTVVAYVSFTCVEKFRFQLHAVVRLKLCWPYVTSVLSSLTLPGTAGFFWMLRFPTITSCSGTASMRRILTEVQGEQFGYGWQCYAVLINKYLLINYLQY